MTSSEFSSDKWGKVSAEEDRELLIKVLNAVNIFFPSYCFQGQK